MDLPPLEEFLTQISPIDKENWHELNWFWKVFQIVKVSSSLAIGSRSVYIATKKSNHGLPRFTRDPPDSEIFSNVKV